MAENDDAIDQRLTAIRNDIAARREATGERMAASVEGMTLFEQQMKADAVSGNPSRLKLNYLREILRDGGFSELAQNPVEADVASHQSPNIRGGKGKSTNQNEIF